MRKEIISRHQSPVQMEIYGGILKVSRIRRIYVVKDFSLWRKIIYSVFKLIYLRGKEDIFSRMESYGQT